MINHFAANLKTLRKQKTYSRRLLALQLSGVTDKNIYTWENRAIQPSYEKLIEIAKYFDVSIDRLLTEKI